MVCLKRLECNLAQVWSEPNGICEWSAAHEKSPVTEGGAQLPYVRTRRETEKAPGTKSNARRLSGVPHGTYLKLRG